MRRRALTALIVAALVVGSTDATARAGAPSSSGADAAASTGAAAASPATAVTAARAKGSLSPPVVPAGAPDVLAIVRSGRARATMVNVWATWCAPCRAEFPALLRVARARQSQGLRLVLVSADFHDQLPAVREFLRAHGVRDTSYIETGEPMAFIDALEPKWSGALPATLVYDGAGTPVAFWEGAADSTRFTEAADRALARTHP
jgi:thiol-disulfide isomerase/thioredoxin